MTWHWRWRKGKWTPRICWSHEAADFRTLIAQHPADKYLECLLYLRLGFKPQQVVEMAKVEIDAVKRYTKKYKEKGLTSYGRPAVRPAKKPKVKEVLPVKAVFRFPEITGKR